MICNVRRLRRSNVLLLLVAVLCIASLVAYQFSENLASYVRYQLRTFPRVQQLPDRTESGRVRCFNVEFSQDELGRICPYQSSSQPLCRISDISHLNQSEFVPASLRIPDARFKTISALVHPPWDLISESVLKWGHWEQPLMLFMRRALTEAPGAGLLDVGSQLGVYTLLAAELGRQAVAIDAFYQNSIRLFASVKANGFQDRVRVYWNALSVKTNEKMNMFLPSDCNIGGGGPVGKASKKGKPSELPDPISVRTASLDEIVISDSCFLGVRELFVKADMEGHEWLVTATGANVFKRFNVSLVMMEWEGTRVNRPDKAAGIIQFYRSHGLLPHSLSGAQLHLLDDSDFKTWPWDVFWATKDLAIRVSAKSGWW